MVIENSAGCASGVPALRRSTPTCIPPFENTSYDHTVRQYMMGSFRKHLLSRRTFCHQATCASGCFRCSENPFRLFLIFRLHAEKNWILVLLQCMIACSERTPRGGLRSCTAACASVRRSWRATAGAAAPRFRGPPPRSASLELPGLPPPLGHHWPHWPHWPEPHREQRATKS